MVHLASGSRLQRKIPSKSSSPTLYNMLTGEVPVQMSRSTKMQLGKNPGGNSGIRTK